jgi:ABC-type sugar transport system, permease component
MIIERRSWTKAIPHIVLALLSLLCLLPFILLFMASISDETAIVKYGYSFFPKAFSAAAYKYLWQQSSVIGHAYLITIGVTAVGTVTSLAITALLAYPLSRKDMPGRGVFAFIVFFTMLFNGGLVPTYLVYTQYVHIKNSIWALLVPSLLLNGFNVLIMRTFFVNSIPPALLEAARIDGAGEFRSLWAIVLPLSLPILATIGLFSAIGYWNDWFNGLIYLTDSRLFSIQNILNRIMSDVAFLNSSSFSSTMMGRNVMAVPSTTVRMAIATVGAIPLLMVYPFFQKYFVKGIAIGAMKG